MAHELNPNHPVVNEMREQWHKLAAVLLFKFRGAGGSALITTHDLERFAAELPGGAIVCDTRGGTAITLRLVDAEEVERLARKEGGLPS
jgi:hypothetical protein